MSSQDANEAGGSETKVNITINDVTYQVTPASGSVSRLKIIGHVPPEDVLCQIFPDQIVHLQDDQTVQILGGERFVSRPNSGGAS
jgi:hypothetical protein